MTNLIRRVGLLYHPKLDESLAMARVLAGELERVGVEPWVVCAWDREEIVGGSCDCQLLVTLGGDGTILRVARSTLPERGAERATTPLLTVNFGTLGFLTELAPDEAVAGLRSVLAGESWIEERAFLRASLERDGEVVEEQDAMNDVVLARADGPHAIRLTLSVDGAWTSSYTADGIIVASPTGSTAYALGAGGPILPPEMSGMVVVPVAPHFAFARSFVVPATARVTLEGSAQKHTIVAVDGQYNIAYEAGDRLHVTYSDAVARFVRIRPRNYFWGTLREKLHPF